MPAKLVIESDADKTRQEVPFTKPSITIGRKPTNDLSFGRPEISGNHAAFTMEGDQFFITDVGSTNGTLLNGAQLVARQKYPFQPGDVVTITPFRITLELERDMSHTLLEEPRGARKGSGTLSEMAGRIETGTAEHVKESVAAAVVQAAAASAAPVVESQSTVPSPPAAAPPPQAPPPKAAAPAAPPPQPPPPKAPEAAPLPPPPVPQPAPAAAPSPKQAAVAEEELPPPTTGLSGVDYLWLGLGGLIALAALAVIAYLLLAV